MRSCLSASDALPDGVYTAYGVHNCRNGTVRMTTYLDAISRHSMQLQEGEDFANDSFIPHLAHIAATC